ncbi:MAG: hypothetical protein E6R03_12755 [Hyphomicrobiaceae bacterium]|nr:MAG: hypothetical protein E6R03_12755 [Hyphomicrobiaceae bacterium]
MTLGRGLRGVADRIFAIAPAPSGDTTGVTDRTNLAALLAAAAIGSKIVLWAGTYYVDQSLVIPQGIVLEGTHKNYTIVKAADGSALTNGVMYSQEYTAGDDTSDAPVLMRDFTVDANRDNVVGGDGIVSMNYWSTFERLLVKNCDGNGIRITATESDASEISNTLVESRISNCDFRSITGDAIRVQDDSNSTQTVTDGFIRDCVFQSIDGNGVRIDSSAGWFITGNHFYGVKRSCIRVHRAFETRITENYGETWGTGTVADGDVYCFIDCSTGGTTGSLIIANNHCFHAGGIQTGRTVRGVSVQVFNGSTADVSVTGNIIRGATHTTATTGVRLFCQGATAVLNAYVSGVSPRGWNTAYSSAANGGTLNISSSSAWVA